MKKIINFSLITTAFLGFLKIFSIIPFNRMAADDFGYADSVIGNGFWQAQRIWYLSWTGKFASTFFESLALLTTGSFGKVIFYSVFTFLLLFLAFVVFFERILNLKATNYIIPLLSSVSMVTLYLITPNKSESWYWLSGSIIYLWPLAFLLFGLSSLFTKNQHKFDYLVSFACIFLASAGNESVGFLINIVLLSPVIINLVKKKSTTLILTMFIASLISYGIVYASPGNAIRAVSPGSNPMSWLGSVLYSVQTSLPHLYSIVQGNVIYLTSLLIAVAYLLSFTSIGKVRNETAENIFIKIFMFIITAIILGVFYLLPGFHTLGRFPPDRSDVTLAFVVLMAMIGISIYLARIIDLFNIRKSIFFQTLVYFVALLLFFSSFKFTSTLASDFYIAKNYSDAYDTMIAKLKNNSGSKKTVVISELPESGLIPPIQLQYTWVNSSVSNYFKVSEIIVKK